MQALLFSSARKGVGRFLFYVRSCHKDVVWQTNSENLGQCRESVEGSKEVSWSQVSDIITKSKSDIITYSLLWEQVECTAHLWALWAGATQSAQRECLARVSHEMPGCLVNTSHWPSPLGCCCFLSLHKGYEQKVCHMLAHYLLCSSCSEWIANKLRYQGSCLLSFSTFTA